MVRLIIMSMLLFSSGGWASALPESFAYEPHLQRAYPVAEMFTSIDRTFRDGDLVPFVQKFPETLSSSWLDQVYADAAMSKAVFLKLGLRPAKDDAFDQFFDQGDGLLIHILVGGKWSVAVLFYGFARADAEKMATSLRKNFRARQASAGASRTMAAVFLPRAAALTCSVHDSAAKGLSQISAAIDKSQGSSVITSCLAEAWKGMKGSALRKLAGIGDTVSELIHRPAEAWHGIVSTFKNLGNFVVNFRSEIGKVIEAGQQIYGELNAELVCAFVGEMSPDIVLLLAGGYGSAKLITAMATYAQRLASVQKFLSLTSKLRSVSESKAATQTFLKRLIRGEVSPQQARAMERFAENGASELAMGAAQCAR